MLADYSELEEENISLQKQVSSLRSSQVEFEGAKHEIRRLTEDLELLNSQVEELMKLKQIAEKQMEEALEALQVSKSINNSYFRYIRYFVLTNVFVLFLIRANATQNTL